MATISSPGIGSGLDVKNIVSQLVALEKKPLDSLKLQASTTQAKISAFGQMKSSVSTLSDAVSKLTSVTGWNAVSATSSNTSAVTASAVGGTLPTTFSVQVNTLAQAQSTVSMGIQPSGSAVGAGTMVFTPAGGGAAVNVDVTATDTISDVASKINGANAGVTASILTSTTGDRLMLRSKATGVSGGFALSVVDADGNNTDALGLSRFVSGSTTTAAAADATATVNGIAVSSSTNTFANTVSGVTFTALQTTATAVDITIAKDTSAVQKNISDFVAAYNAINGILNEATKYDAATKSAGLLQGDSTAITLQSSLHNVIQAVTTGSSVFQRLADIGITQQRGGDLTIDSAKLATSLSNSTEVKNLFASTGGGSANGIAVQLYAVTKNMLASDGFFQTKDGSLKRALTQNAKDQTRVNDHAAKVEASLNARYSALDAKVASLNALNAYVGQQVTTWNKSSG